MTLARDNHRDTMIPPGELIRESAKIFEDRIVAIGGGDKKTGHKNRG
jgi:hypothetical protein